MNQNKLTKKNELYFRKIIYKNWGVQFPTARVYSQILQKAASLRASELNIPNVNLYFSILKKLSVSDFEWRMLIEKTGVQKTKFFRYSIHFKYLKEIILSQFLKSNKSKTFHVLSAGCSTGEEPYSYAIVISNLLHRYKHYNFKIDAVDFGKERLMLAELGVYKKTKVNRNVPKKYFNEYFVSKKNKNLKLCLISDELKSHINFKVYNLFKDNSMASKKYHLVVCSNVLCFFDNKSKEKILENIRIWLKPNGYLIISPEDRIKISSKKWKKIKDDLYQKNEQ